MSKTLRFTRTAGAVLGLVLASALLAAAQQPAAVKPAEQVYKNIQVLTGVPSNQIIPTMQFMRDSLGVTCEFCHVDDRTKREADDKPAKKTARTMIAMELAINKDNFNARPTVTCFTCHRGTNAPVGSPVVPSEHPVLLDKEETPNLPSVDDIVAKYVTALGGEDAIRKVNSRVITYTRDQSAAPGAAAPPPTVTVERDEKAPNQVVNIAKSPAGTATDGFDGTAAWTLDAKGKVSDVNGPALDAAKRGADFYGDLGLDLNLKQRYTRLAARRIDKVEARDAYVVYAFKQAGAPPDWLYFDTQTGLLLRLVEFNATPLGNDPTYTDYHDYRNVGGGLKYPFQVDRYGMAAFTTISVQKVQNNAPVDSSKFSKPAGQ
jgi:photosynthetic reaction center cytochrome c subunit